MSTDYQLLYINDTKMLAKTMVIKSQKSVDLVNDLLTMKYGQSITDLNDPTTWKYYLNICGQYHKTDTMMRVTSLDTLEVIDFTLDNLKIHTATAAAYAYGSRFYYSLVDKHPTQEQLILGILYPCDMELAISAPDTTILNYPRGLVEPQEITLIEELQAWLYRYVGRWDVQAFGVTHSLYPVAQHALMYLQLLPKLLNLRLKRCKTDEAHSFHIRTYLASHGNLDRYYDYMTNKQALFLYRNLNYIRLNNGKMDIFNWLVEKILTDRKIPIAEYQLRLQSSFDDKYFPNYHFKKIPLNTEFNTPNQDYYSVDMLLEKESKLAKENSDYILHNRDVIDKTLKNSASSVALTKDLESSMIDYTGNEVYPLRDVLWDLWGWMSANKLYHAAISFKDPKTGEIRSMFSDDAFIYYLMILMHALGDELKTVPRFILTRVPRLTLPTLNQLMDVVDKKLFKDNTLAIQLLGEQPRIGRAISVSSFNSLGTKFFEAHQKQWYLRSRTEHVYERANIEFMISQFYQNSVVQFEDDGMDMSLWLKKKSIPVYNYSLTECYELLQNIFKAATGLYIDPTKVVGNIQRAMIAIMSDLSSYSIQIIQQINSSPIMRLNWAGIRLGDQNTGIKNESLAQLPHLQVNQIVGIKDNTEFALNKLTPLEPETVVIKHALKDDFGLTFNIKADVEEVLDYRLFNYRINVEYDNYNPKISENTIAIGMEEYELLNNVQRTSISDIYNSKKFQITDKSNEIALTDILPFNELDLQSPIPITVNVLGDPNKQ